MGRITRTDQDDFGMGGLANVPAFPGTPEFGRHTEAQESRGQRELVESTDLPSKSHGQDAEFKALGFTFGEPHRHDPLFRPATLPPGWRKQAMEHSMGTHIVDEKGRQRVEIFYKAASYDRRADMHLIHPQQWISHLVYADKEPSSIPFDDMLTVELVRGYLASELAHEIEYRELTRQQNGNVKRYDQQIERIKHLQSLLPGDA